VLVGEYDCSNHAAFVGFRANGVSGRTGKSDRPRCACGKPCWEGTRSRYARGRCWKCAETLIRAASVRRLVKSGAMAAMRRALEGCPDNGRTIPEPMSPLTEAGELARALLVGMANAERDRGTDGEVAISPVRRGGRTIHSHGMVSTIPIRSSPGGLKFTVGR